MSKYFSHDVNARHDEKLIALRMKYNWLGYGLYWAIIEKLCDSGMYYKLNKDYNLLAYDLRADASTIKSIIEDFGLFVFTDDGKYLYSESLLKRMEIKDDKIKKLSEAGKKGNAKRWGNDVDLKQYITFDDSDDITTLSPPDRHPITIKFNFI